MKFICAKLLYKTNRALASAWLVFALLIPSSIGATEIVGYPARGSIERLNPQSSVPSYSSQQKASTANESTLSPEVALEIARQFVESVGLPDQSSSPDLATMKLPQSEEVVSRSLDEPSAQIIHQASTSVSPPIDPHASTGPSNAKNLSLPTLRYESHGMGYEVSREGSSIAYGDEDSSLEARIGLGYGGMNRSRGISLSAAKLINPDLALGGALETRSRQTDLSINLISQLGSLSTLSLSLGHMRGKESFNFFSGAAETDISQSALALSYLGGSSTDNGEVNSWGLSVWGARSNQGSNLSPITHTIETATSYDTYLDPRKLSEGRLVGGSLSFQYRQRDKFLFHPSLGYERLEFPYADGTRETYERPTASLEMQYQFDNEAKLKWATRSGIAERRSTIGVQWGAWWVDAFYSEGLRGLKDNRGVSINYSLLNGRHNNPSRPRLASLDQNAAPSPEKDLHSGKELLNSAMARPSAFPRVWLAKVDNSAVTLIQSTAKITTTTSWTTTSLGAMYFDSGTPNRSSISLSVSATSNDGSAVTYSWGSDPDNLSSVLSLNTNTGVISGSHTAVVSDKTYTFRIVATANGVSSTSNDFTLTIKAPVRVRFTTAGDTVELGTALTTANSITFPSQLTSIELLLVGGGGAGGGDDGGGGGGGGAVGYGAAFSVTGGQTVSVSVGAGGAGSTARGQSGSATLFGSLSAPGGGGGGQSNPDYEGLSGGSGGGASQRFAGGGTGTECGTTTASGVAFQCNAGGGATLGGVFYGGSGGGGATGIGSTATSNNGVNGGAGRTVPVSLGTLTVGAGGGGGGAGLAGNSAGTGGSGIGGDGGTSLINPSSGAAHTGSGGGGGGLGGAVGGDGAGGLIILRY